MAKYGDDVARYRAAKLRQPRTGTSRLPVFTATERRTRPTRRSYHLQRSVELISNFTRKRSVPDHQAHKGRAARAAWSDLIRGSSTFPRLPTTYNLKIPAIPATLSQKRPRSSTCSHFTSSTCFYLSDKLVASRRIQLDTSRPTRALLKLHSSTSNCPATTCHHTECLQFSNSSSRWASPKTAQSLL